MAKITWNRNLEYEGLQLQSSEKPSQDVINQLKANGFKWSSRQRLWYAKELPYRVAFLNTIATFEGEIGEVLSFAEKMERKVERAEERAERFEDLAEKTSLKAEELHNQAHKMASIIPFGQPIHGATDRNYRDKIHNKFGKSFETAEKAEYFEQRAKAAAKFEQKTFNLGTTLRRLEKLLADQRSPGLDSDRHIVQWEADLFRFKHGLDTKRWTLLSRTHLQSNENRADSHNEEIEYWQSVIRQKESEGLKVWTPKDFKKGDIIQTRFGFGLVLKTNPKTVKVEFIGMAKDAWEQKADLSKVPYNELSQNCKTGKTIDQFPQYYKVEA